jgi:hypothetical protein
VHQLETPSVLRFLLGGLVFAIAFLVIATLVFTVELGLIGWSKKQAFRISGAAWWREDGQRGVITLAVSRASAEKRAGARKERLRHLSRRWEATPATAQGQTV